MKQPIPRIALAFAFLFSAGSHAADFTTPLRSFIGSHCAECHDADAKKGGLNFDALSTELDDAAIEARWTLAHDRVQRGEMPPKKKAPPTARDRDDFLRSLGDALSAHDAAQRAKIGRVLLRRLNRVEYESTLHDLLTIDAPLDRKSVV